VGVQGTALNWVVGVVVWAKALAARNVARMQAIEV
jgi:hypothetical protein